MPPQSLPEPIARLLIALGASPRLVAHLALVHVVQFTPPGSECSIIFGKGVTSAEPGSAQGLHLVVSDIEAERADLVGRGVQASEVFHDATELFHHAGTAGRVPGLDPGRRSYGSYVSFRDPDGNGWFIQEVKQRAPGR